MASTYEVTGQHYVSERQADGTYVPSVEVTFTTTTPPVVHGSVSVPRTMLADAVGYAQAVKERIESAVAAHDAVNALGTSQTTA